MGGQQSNNIEGKWKIVRWSENRLFIWQFSRPALILIKAVFMSEAIWSKLGGKKNIQYSHEA